MSSGINKALRVIEEQASRIEELEADVEEAHDKTAEVRTAWKHLADENERLRAALLEKQERNESLAEYNRQYRAALERIAALDWPQPKALKIAREALNDETG